MGEGRVPYVQSIAAATHIFSHDVKAKEGEARSVIDAGDRRGRSAVEFANEETIRIYTRKAGRVGEARTAQSTAIEISSGRILRMCITMPLQPLLASLFRVDALAIKIV